MQDIEKSITCIIKKCMIPFVDMYFFFRSLKINLMDSLFCVYNAGNMHTSLLATFLTLTNFYECKVYVGKNSVLTKNTKNTLNQDILDYFSSFTMSSNHYPIDLDSKNNNSNNSNNNYTIDFDSDDAEDPNPSSYQIERCLHFNSYNNISFDSILSFYYKNQSDDYYIHQLQASLNIIKSRKKYLKKDYCKILNGELIESSDTITKDMLDKMNLTTIIYPEEYKHKIHI